MEGKPPQGIDGHHYRGINRFLLALVESGMGYESPYWLTFHRALQLGGNVRRGEKGALVVYANKTPKEVEVENEQGEKERRLQFCPFLKAYTVFNLEQCEGITADNLPKNAREVVKRPPLVIPDEIREAGEAVWNGYTNPPRRLPEGGGSAYYSPSADEVKMPKAETFESGADYYATLFHEMIHSTGHESRLARIDKPAAFGTKDYGKEELVAEMGAALLCNHSGILPQVFDNSAAYLGGWIKTIREQPSILISAAAAAQKAADWILGTKQEEEEADR